MGNVFFPHNLPRCFQSCQLLICCMLKRVIDCTCMYWFFFTDNEDDEDEDFNETKDGGLLLKYYF